MDETSRESLAQLLRKQRQHFLEEFRRAEDHLGFIAEERGSEIEERAQEERSARLLASLDDRTLFAVQEIDAALQRLIDGSYGRCEVCRKKIRIARLRALPATRFCKNCAGQRETKALSSPEESIARTRPQPSGRLALFDQTELAETVGEQPMEEFLMQAQEPRNLCRKDIGHFPDASRRETELRTLFKTTAPALDLKELADRISVENLIWEQYDRSREFALQAPSGSGSAYRTEAVGENSEEGCSLAPQKLNRS